MMLRAVTLVSVLVLGACALQSGHPGVAESGSDYAVPPAAESRFREAVLAMEEQHWDRALPAMEALWQDYPFLSGPALNAALMHDWQDRPEQAEQWFERALQSNPANVDAHNEFAVFLREQGRYAAARQQYRAALAVDPQDPVTHYNLGILCDLYLGEKQQALEHFSRYQQLTGAEDRRVAGWMVDLQRQLDAQGGT